MFIVGVLKYLWSEAVVMASYLINRMPNKILKFQTLLQFLKVFP